ncbi:MAG: helix-turn-helix domain-containing protein [Lachnospira sp.]|nr:helix-turn-helix domain-containing protein [Lachnospira sp.]
MLDKNVVGKNIVAYRKHRGINQKELAKMLNISAQSVSKWESGISLPTLEMVYELAKVLDVSVDSILSDVALENRDICYMDTGLDTKKLYALKEEINSMVTKDENLLLAHFMAPVVFKMDTANMEEPVFIIETSVPGSKQRLAIERNCDKEICMDVTATAINNVLRFGFMPKLMKAHVVCGNISQDRLRNMVKGFKQACEANGVIFAGMGISAQPVNYNDNEYEITASLIGACDSKDIIKGDAIREGDVAIGIIMDGVEASSYPFVRVMLNKKPEIAYKIIEDGTYLPEELLKPASPCVHAVKELQEKGILNGVFRINSTMFHPGLYAGIIPDGLGLCVDLSSIPVHPMYKYLKSLDLVGNNRFHYRFNLGVGMILAVPKDSADKALKIIEKYHKCCVVGAIKSNSKMDGEIVWCEGELQW